MLVLDNDDGGDGSDGVDGGSLSERVSIVYFVCSCQKKKEILISPFFTLFSFFFCPPRAIHFLFFLSHYFSRIRSYLLSSNHVSSLGYTITRIFYVLVQLERIVLPCFRSHTFLSRYTI